MPDYVSNTAALPFYLAQVAAVETLMGRRPELRFDYIQKNARFTRDLDV